MDKSGHFEQVDSDPTRSRQVGRDSRVGLTPYDTDDMSKVEQEDKDQEDDMWSFDYH